MSELPRPGTILMAGLFDPPRFIYEDQSVANTYQEYVDTLLALFGYPTIPIFHARRDYGGPPVPGFVEASTHYDTTLWVFKRQIKPIFIVFESASFHTPDEILWALGHEVAHVVQFNRLSGQLVNQPPHGKDFVDSYGEVILAAGMTALSVAHKALAFEIVYSDDPLHMLSLVKYLGLDYEEIYADRSRYKDWMGRIDIEQLYSRASAIAVRKGASYG